MALSLDDFKQFALDNAGASDNGQAPPAQPMPNINPSMGQQIAQSINATPNAPPVTQVQPKEGPIKSFLTQFIHGAGQGLLSHVGLQTDAERQQVQFNQAQQQASAQRQAQLQQAQIQNYQSQEEQRKAQSQLVDTSTLGIPGLSGQVLQKDLPRVIVQHLANQGKVDVQGAKNQGGLDIQGAKNEGSQAVATTNATAKTDVEKLRDDLMTKIQGMKDQNKITLNLNSQENPYAKAAAPQVAKMYGDAAAASVRQRAMDEALPKSIAGDAQADMVILMNHIGMTGGAQKGFRMNQAEINSAVKARGLGPEVEAMFRKVQTGNRLTPDEARQMVDLAHSQNDNMWQQADQQAELYGLAKPVGRNKIGGSNTVPSGPTGAPATPAGNHPFFQQFGGAPKKP